MKTKYLRHVRALGVLIIGQALILNSTSCSVGSLGGANVSQSSNGIINILNPIQMGSPQNIWNQDITQATVDPNSTGIIGWLVGNGGWGGYVGYGSCNGMAGYACNNFSIEPAFYLMHANASTPMAPLQKTATYYTPDCDNLTQFPLPPGGSIEGGTGYTCPAGGGCHLMVYNDATSVLYESYQSNVSGGTLTSQCAVMWNMAPTNTYSPTLRDNPLTNVGSGDQCTSADAGGFPMAAFIFSADDIARGSIDHALRLTLPNSQMRANVYLRPAVHIGGPSATATSLAPPYGARFRLKSNYNMSGFSAGGQVVARALQKYGMLIADGGDHCVSAFADTFTTHKWTDANVNLTAINADITTLTPADFEVVYGGAAPITYNGSCRRTPLAN